MPIYDKHIRLVKTKSRKCRLPKKRGASRLTHVPSDTHNPDVLASLAPEKARPIGLPGPKHLLPMPLPGTTSEKMYLYCLNRRGVNLHQNTALTSQLNFTQPCALAHSISASAILVNTPTRIAITKLTSVPIKKYSVSLLARKESLPPKRKIDLAAMRKPIASYC